MRHLACLFCCLLGLSGCVANAPTTLTGSTISGFGSAGNPTDAQKAAWDDAVARIHALGFKDFNFTTQAGGVTHDGQTYSAKVVLFVQRDHDVPAASAARPE